MAWQVVTWLAIPVIVDQGTGPIESLDSENWNRRQFYSVTKVDASGKQRVLAEKLPCPP